MNYIKLESLRVDDFNDPSWKNKCPKEGEFVHTRFNARIMPYTIFGDEWNDFDTVELIFVARINTGGTFTAYWATANEALLGAIYYPTEHDVEYVALHGRKMRNLFAASSIFYNLSVTYRLKAIV